MRPVDKGTAPVSTYTNYAEALPDLEQRLGRYCSYCERYIATNLAVEHVQAKSLVPALALMWSNFLLACVNCNSCKGDTPVTVNDYLWPDSDNTLRAFEYRTGGVVAPHSALAAPVRAKAQASAALVGLDRVPGGAVPPTQRDLRWLKRFETWRKANNAHRRLSQNDTVELREQIVDTALATGLFSIWWTVFAADENMRSRLRAAFVGTCPNSFDANENLQARPGGQL
ncbi:HNH endonuclease [Corallococcus sp. AS-1-6]|uniref:HNH endonuclease n=1 Tax=Corallococcus sp. AS-1-6 TaxID=2874599 RepID=UPI001CC13F22|nr:HNH endonuclease [Corallococcus sp. AS-1-6]